MEDDILYWQVMNLLDDDCVFKEFESPVNHVDEQLANATNEFIFALTKDEYESYIYNISALMAIKIMCEEYNKNVCADIELRDLSVFQSFYNDTISEAKFLAEKTGNSVENALLYGFVYADALLYLTDESKKVLDIYTKKLLKPVHKIFKKDFMYACQMKYGYRV